MARAQNRRKMDKRLQYPGWNAYYAANDVSGNQRNFLVYSPRTVYLAGIVDFPDDGKDFYARDFYDRHTEEVKGDYGNIYMRLPDLIHVDGYGVKNLKIKKRSGVSPIRETGFLDLPVVNYNEGRNKRYNRLTSKSPAAYIKTSIEHQDELVITNLQSFNNRTGASHPPVFYSFEGVGLYSDPTQWDGAEGFVWNDDMQYPIPETLIPELNKRILVQEFNITKQTIDDRVDDNVDTTNVQQKVQRQIRQS